MEFINLHQHSTLGSHDSHSQVEDIVKHISTLNQSASALTEHGSMSSAIRFYTGCKKYNIKPILGLEAYICPNQKSATEKSPDNRKLNHFVLLAKNKIGYQNLLKLVYLSNQPAHYYYKPRIDESMLFEHSEGVIAINGHYDTALFDQLIFNMGAASKCKTVDEAREFLFPDYKAKLLPIATRYREVFGEDFYIECQLFDRGDVVQQLTATTLYEFAREFGFKAVGTGDCHYIAPKDAPAHKTYVAIKQNSKVKSLPDIGYFNSDTYCIITNERAQECYPEELILATQEIASKVEEYEIIGPQKIPRSYPAGKTAIQEVKDLCEAKLKETGKWNDEYCKRLEYELSITELGELEHYFLIVRDYIQWCIDNKILVGPARGSSAGSLICYLLGITYIDPIVYDLLFDRFYSPDRAINKVLPDIDTDFQTSRRSEVIDYIRNKYGADKVCGVVTFGELHGKSAIKSVLSAWEVCDHTQQKNISDLIQSKDKISDKLADFKEETGSDSILLYTLTHEPEALKDYARLEDGKIIGEYAAYFELAIELEGSIKTESRHASAIIISDVPIYTVAPMIKDKNEDNLLCAFDMYSFENAGLVKFDILGLKALDGLFEVNVLLKDLDIEIDPDIQNKIKEKIWNNF